MSSSLENRAFHNNLHSRMHLCTGGSTHKNAVKIRELGKNSGMVGAADFRMHLCTGILIIAFVSENIENERGKSIIPL